MTLDWLGKHEYFISKLMKFGNAYALNYSTERDLGLGVSFSASELQTLEYILINEDRYLKMAEMAAQLGITTSTFSKNINKMVKKRLLDKYHMSNNKKEVIVRVSDYGKEIYREYCTIVKEKIYDQVFMILDQIPAEYETAAADVIDLIAKENSNTATQQHLHLKKLRGENCLLSRVKLSDLIKSNDYSNWFL